MFDPIFLFVTSKFCFLYGLGYTAPTSPLRPLLFLSILVTCLTAVRSPSIYFVPGAAGCDYVIGFIFHASNFLLIAKRVPPPTVITIYDKGRWAFREIFAARWGITHIPPFSKKDRSYVPSRRRLFLDRLFDLIWTFSLAWYLEENHLFPWDEYLDPGAFLLRWHEVSQRELLIRMYLAVRGMFIPYLGLRAGHSFASCVALSFGADPKDWPPLYGSVREAYTVRRWYSHFWHHAMRRALVAHGSLLTYYFLSTYHGLLSLLGFKHRLDLSKSLRSPLARYLTTIFSFLTSAAMHVLTCPRIELQMIVPELWVHLGTAAAVVLEDTLLASYNVARRWMETSLSSSKENFRRLTEESVEVISTAYHSGTGAKSRRTRRASKHSSDVGNTTKQELGAQAEKHIPKKRLPGITWKAVGYVWVGVFWTWSISNLMYAIYNS